MGGTYPPNPPSPLYRPLNSSMTAIKREVSYLFIFFWRKREVHRRMVTARGYTTTVRTDGSGPSAYELSAAVRRVHYHNNRG